MVMSKVSKAIAASFLCLTINAGGATNAMNAPKSNMTQVDNQASNQANNEIENNNINNVLNSRREVFDINAVDVNKQDENNNNDGNKDKTPDGEKSIWRWLIPLIAGFGGLVLGIGLGKFAF